MNKCPIEIEFFRSLEISEKKPFLQYMSYINQKIVNKTIYSYLNFIIKDYSENYLSINDFLSLITMHIYPEEFIITDVEPIIYSPTPSDYDSPVIRLNDKLRSVFRIY